MMLCSFEPVKYCRAAPNDSAGTARRSTCTPAVRRSDIFVSPRASTEATAPYVARWSIDGGDLAGDDQEIQVADRLLAPPVAAGGGDLFDRRAWPHVLQDFPHVLVGFDPEDPLLRFGGDVEALQNGRLHLGAEALEALDAMILAGGAQFVERGDMELVVELRRPLRPQPRHAQDRHHALRHHGAELFEHRQRARFDQGGHLLGQVLADAFNLRERTARIAHDHRGRLGQVVDRPRGSCDRPACGTDLRPGTPTGRRSRRKRRQFRDWSFSRSRRVRETHVR